MHDASAWSFAVLCLLGVSWGAACGPTAVETSLVVGASARLARGQRATGSVDRTDIVGHASLRFDERVIVGQLEAAPMPRSLLADGAAFPCAHRRLCTWERQMVGRALAVARRAPTSPLAGRDDR